MKSGLEVVAHPTGPWLVRAGAVVFAVPAALAQPLVMWQGRCPSVADLAAGAVPPDTDPEQWAAFVAAVGEALDGGGSARGIPPPIWLRLPLLPTGVVRLAAARLAFLTSGRGLMALGLVGLAGYIQLGMTAVASPIRLGPGAVGAALGLFFLTAVWHELGHAAALARHGYPPGGIGAGLLFVIPVLFADVTAVGALPRRGRLRVDVSGVGFQFGLGGFLALLSPLGAVPAIAAWLALLAVAWSLFPFIRADGYWVVCDLLGVVGLEHDPVPAPGPGLRVFLRLYRLANAVFLLGVGFVLPLRYMHRFEAVLAHLGIAEIRPLVLVPLMVVGAGVLAVVWWNILRRVWDLVVGACKVYDRG
ncbi:MAG: hypothetical protein QNL91_14695 [Candidatus Krumholzibacteria bacterium]|nr:hypothetical protein [Candidatus Krumholzibacteria bacterium]